MIVAPKTSHFLFKNKAFFRQPQSRRTSVKNQTFFLFCKKKLQAPEFYWTLTQEAYSLRENPCKRTVEMLGAKFTFLKSANVSCRSCKEVS